jgi:hypothetical protein
MSEIPKWAQERAEELLRRTKVTRVGGEVEYGPVSVADIAAALVEAGEQALRSRDAYLSLLRGLVFEGLDHEARLIPSEALRLKLVVARHALGDEPKEEQRG